MQLLKSNSPPGCGVQSCTLEKLFNDSTFQRDSKFWFFGKITSFSTFNLQMEMDFFTFDFFIYSLREEHFLWGLAGVNEMVFFIIIKMLKPYFK
jgi:hypothetical protein